VDDGRPVMMRTAGPEGTAERVGEEKRAVDVAQAERCRGSRGGSSAGTIQSAGRCQEMRARNWAICDLAPFTWQRPFVRGREAVTLILANDIS